jgi:hypothetical protein
MALAQCWACGGEVSAEAKSCPGCRALVSARQGPPPARPAPPPSSLFRKPPLPGAARDQQQTAVITRPAPASTGATTAAREAAIRRWLLWGGGALALVSILFVLARTVTMMVVVVPLGILCLGAMGLGLVRGVVNRGLPYLPRTRRVHSLLLVVAAPFVFAFAAGIVPRNAAEQRELEEGNKRAAAAQAEAERQSKATTDCQTYILEHLQVPSSASLPGSPKVFRWDRQEGGYVIRGAVEAQNAFGARLRRIYECTADAGGQLVSGRILE